MVHFRSRGIGLEQCIQLMKNSRNGTIWFHGEREKNTKLFFYHYLMSVSDKLLFRKRAIIETVNDELKNIAQVEHSKHRCFDNFIVNLLGAIAAYCLFPKKPYINVQRTMDAQLALF